jgi:hypothetical protein
MAHIRVERFRAGHREEDGAQHQEAGHAVLAEERDGVARVERLEHARRREDAAHSEGREDDEPDEHDGAEQAPDRRRAAPLDREEADEDTDGDRDDEVVELRRREVQAFDG